MCGNVQCDKQYNDVPYKKENISCNLGIIILRDNIANPFLHEHNTSRSVDCFHFTSMKNNALKCQTRTVRHHQVFMTTVLFKIMFQTESNLYPSSTQKVQCTHDSGFYSVYVSISSYVGVATNQIQYMHLLIECTQTIQVV